MTVSSGQCQVSAEPRDETMSRKFICFALYVLLLALSFPAEAQQAKKVPRVGFLMPGSRTTYAVRIEGLARDRK
jgi:hypothetical protein